MNRAIRYNNKNKNRLYHRNEPFYVDETEIYGKTQKPHENLSDSQYVLHYNNRPNTPLNIIFIIL